MNTAPLRAVVAAHAAAAVAPTPEGATPAVSASAPLIGATAVAPAPLGSAPVLRKLTPVIRVVVVVSLDAGRGLAGARALGSSSLIRSALSTKGALVTVAAAEVRCRQEVEDQSVDQVDARRG